MLNLHGLALWIVFSVTCIFAFVYKAVLATGSEDHIFAKADAYFQAKPLTVIMRFLLAQLFYFFIFANPALLGEFLFGSAVASKIVIGPYALSCALGLAGDKLADIVIVAAGLAYRRIVKVFANGDGGVA